MSSSDYERQKQERDEWIAQNSNNFILAKEDLALNVSQVSGMAAKIEAMRADKYHWLTEYKDREFEFVSRAAHSENSAITYQETFEILNGRTDGIAAEKIAVVRGIVKARELVISAVIEDTKPDINLYKAINREIESGISYEAGLIRGQRPDKSGLGTFVSLGNGISFVPPEPGIQGENLVKIFQKVSYEVDNSFLSITMLCAKLTYSQVFYNGNKRTAREFANALLLQAGFPAISVANEEKYLQAVTVMNKLGDATNLAEYFCNTILGRK